MQVKQAATLRGLDAAHLEGSIDRAADTLQSVAAGDSASAAALSSSLARERPP